ncbi:hypothetical protein [Sphingobacterium paucimobilis]|uniref:Uncharacterized protein n=1 Tax=Sphingobacterium paucimobilis HER1398 TaxID=1346330 RepID=U2JBS0_9SPHI|nr:hypothetical protein [Sphingobacterium paucimobilis]ERJ60088.1 hypothetical protein M472_15090 [Sphingobacterium paucimobilis HER1398]
MKKIILTGLSFLFAVTMLFAQEINPENKAKETVTELTEKLTLTDDQQAAVYDIVLEKVQAKIAVKSDTTLSEDVVKQQIEALTATANGKINDLLTEDQKPIFIQYLEEKMANKEEKI